MDNDNFKFELEMKDLFWLSETLTAVSFGKFEELNKTEANNLLKKLFDQTHKVV